MKKYIVALLVSVAVLTTSVYHLVTQNYTTPYPHAVQVLQKYQGVSNRGIETAIVFEIVDLPNHLVFDREVSLSTYTLYNVGDRLTYTISNEQLYPNIKQELFMALSATGTMFGLFFTIAFGMCVIQKHQHKRRIRNTQ